MIKLSELQRLDKVSLSEVEEIIETYENLRMAMTRDINLHGGNIDEYKKFIESVFLQWGHLQAADEVELKRTAKFFAILEQMKAERSGGAGND